MAGNNALYSGVCGFCVAFGAAPGLMLQIVSRPAQRSLFSAFANLLADLPKRSIQSLQQLNDASMLSHKLRIPVALAALDNISSCIS